MQLRPSRSSRLAGRLHYVGGAARPVGHRYRRGGASHWRIPHGFLRCRDRPLVGL